MPAIGTRQPGRFRRDLVPCTNSQTWQGQIVFGLYQIRFPFRVNEIRLTAIHAPGGRGLPIILCYFPGSDFFRYRKLVFFLR